VALGLTYWYVTAVALSVAGFILAWIWLFRLGPTDEYWACMDSHARAFKGTYQAEEVFLAADAECSRPPGLTEQAAHAEWLRRWETL
jgi:hypothetical protein